MDSVDVLLEAVVQLLIVEDQQGQELEATRDRVDLVLGLGCPEIDLGHGDFLGLRQDQNHEKEVSHIEELDRLHVFDLID